MIYAKYLLACSILIGAVSCDYNKPDEPLMDNHASELSKATHTIAQLKELYQGGATHIAEDVIVEGTIISDDTEGNLYRTAYVQDATGGIELKLGVANLSTLYPQGSTVQIHAKGMTLGRYGGQINLGYRALGDRYETGFYPELTTPQVLRFKQSGKVEPKTLTITTLSKAYAGQLVKIDEVQFLESDLKQTFAAPQNKNTQANVNRTLVDRSGKSLIVRTSSYARFAGKQLPSGSGSITAILTYFNNTPQLLLLKEQDAQLNGPRF